MKTSIFERKNFYVSKENSLQEERNNFLFIWREMSQKKQWKFKRNSIV